MTYPVIDLHCDLLSYLEEESGSTWMDTEKIGCALPHLQNGHVRLQIMAIYTATEKGSTKHALREAEIFAQLKTQPWKKVTSAADLDACLSGSETGVMVSIENASGFCEEDEPLEVGFSRLEQIMNLTGKPLYIGFTHHGENRFGGGNNTPYGLKPDGENLLDYLHNKNIAVDFSHTSDALAHDILNYTYKHGLNIPVLASHSNYRPVFKHVRNLPDEITRELLQRKALIGVNFLRAFMHTEKPEVLKEHIAYGLKMGGEDAVCMGADFFYTGSHPDRSRVPFYFPAHEDASCYPSILNELEMEFGKEQTEKIAYRNAQRFINQVLGK